MEQSYLLKNGKLYDLNSAGIPTDIENVSMPGYNLLIDDAYFFCVCIGTLKVNRSKLRSVVENYLQAYYPLELFSGFALFEANQLHYALLYRDEFKQILNSFPNLFKLAGRISTALAELTVRYDEFSFKGGNTIYSKNNAQFEVIPEAKPNTLGSSDIMDTIMPFKVDVQFVGVERLSGGNKMYTGLIAALVICYLCFLGHGILDINALKKELNYYESSVEVVYAQAGVANSGDPYGTLVAQASKKQLAPFKILPEISKIGLGVNSGLTIDSFSVTDKVVRLEGSVKTFEEMEHLKSALEKATKKTVNIDESKENAGVVKYIMRYEP